MNRLSTHIIQVIPAPVSLDTSRLSHFHLVPCLNVRSLFIICITYILLIFILLTPKECCPSPCRSLSVSLLVYPSWVSPKERPPGVTERRTRDGRGAERVRGEDRVRRSVAYHSPSSPHHSSPLRSLFPFGSRMIWVTRRRDERVTEWPPSLASCLRSPGRRPYGGER